MFACPSSKSLCLNGHCVVPPCADPILPDAAPPPACAPGTTCCGTGCCTGNEICCNVERGGPSGLPGTGLGWVDPSKSNGTCPIGCPLCVCASPDTPIATPAGDRAIATLAVGDLVYSVDHGEVSGGGSYFDDVALVNGIETRNGTSIVTNGTSATLTIVCGTYHGTVGHVHYSATSSQAGSSGGSSRRST